MTKKRAFFVLLIFAGAFAFYLAYQADQAHRGRTPREPTAASMITGTWKTEDGALFQFRYDGTGRSRNPDNPQFDVNYFEWDTDGNSVTVCWPPRGRIARFIAHMTAVETAVFRLQDVTENQFTLSETPTIKTRFHRTEDAVLQQAP